jgi:putative transposase
MLIKQGFARRVGRIQRIESRGSKGERTVWQRRYWEHLVRDEDDFARHVDYIHFNPVKHGHALRAADWPYSSFHRYVREGKLPADWGVAAVIGGSYGE